ncbi:MAG: hypothetical protein CMN28_00985 [Salinisphaeraceae bacterium]|uniref:TolC family protein n=1 Tax=Spectribacter hydrogenoxidans TaxID=3075608 RepID=A0ABU3C317_9GAMM|nr:TolC family protein [Salinisphaera sp. W335]MAA73266.1 hypothetical protein [Salinisphaeraceae bacterium]MDT0635954.1 TolC family protein [Salinisphaera sp. W335]
MSTIFLRRVSRVFLAAAIAAASVNLALAQTSPKTEATSPVLRGFIQTTLETNPGILAARAEIEAAGGRVAAADRPIYNPQLQIEAEQSESRLGTVGLEQALDWSDKRGANTNIASAELQVARAEYIVRRQELTGELLSGLADYHTAEAAQALAQERARLMTDFSDLSQKRRRAGDLSQIELDLASLARTQADLELSLAATDLAQAGQNLAAVTGQAVQDWPELPADIPAPVDFNAQALLTALPQIRALQARSAAARARVELRRRERRPDPTVGATVGQERTFRNGEDGSFGVVGLNLSVPLFVRNSFAAEVDTASAELAEAEQTKHEAFRRARARLLSAAERYRLSHAAWQAWQRSGRPSLSSQVSQLDRIWKYGEMSTADYLVQLNQTLETRAVALKIQNRLWDAWADWLVASGEVDDWLTRKP